jgi:hypothetical protein
MIMMPCSEPRSGESLFSLSGPAGGPGPGPTPSRSHAAATVTPPPLLGPGVQPGLTSGLGRGSQVTVTRGPGARRAGGLRDFAVSAGSSGSGSADSERPSLAPGFPPSPERHSG